MRWNALGLVMGMQMVAALASVTEAQDVMQTFPGSMQVEMYLPRAISEEDAAYFVWISGASAEGAAVVDGWARSTAPIDANWIAELIGPLRQPASDYAAQSREIQDYGERAKALKELMRRRDDAVTQLFGRERTSLQDALARVESDDSMHDLMVDQIMLARRADAFTIPGGTASQLAANILRLLHDAASDQRTGPEASASIRKLARDNLARVAEQRLSLVGATAKSGYMAYEARQRAISAGKSAVGAGASAFRPVALAGAQLGAVNLELAAMARELLPPDVSRKLDERLLLLTYGALAADIFAFETVVAMLEPLVPEGDRAAVAELCLESSRRRVAARDRMLREFDVTRRRFVESGLVRDMESWERFGRLLLEFLQASRTNALQAIGRIADLARAHPSWSERRFEEAKGEWASEARGRLDDIALTGVASPIVTRSGMDEIIRQVFGP
jgi:hypothetical protein